MTGLTCLILTINMRSKSASKKTEPRFGGAFCLPKIVEFVFNRGNGVCRIEKRGIKTDEVVLYQWNDIVYNIFMYYNISNVK